MAASLSSSSSVISRLRNRIRVLKHARGTTDSLGSNSSLGRIKELLVPDEIRGRVVLYDAFISHRGSDSKSFAKKIHDDLKGLGVKSFFDSEGIYKGENLSAVIVEAISASTVLLVLLSKGFAESPWCLEELRFMVEKVKEEENKAILIPVFCNVEPDDLRDVSHGAYKKAFKNYRKGREFHSGTIEKWEETLKEVAGILGPRLSDFKGRKDQLARAVVGDTVKRVKNVDMEVAKFPVAVDQRVHEIKDLINSTRFHNHAPCLLGIVGMTGIGKSTVARQFFNLYRSSFKSAYFVDSVNQKTESIGLASIQQTLLKELALLEADVRDVAEGMKLLKKRLQGAEVLLVLDDVDDGDQLEAFMMHEVLNPASVVLVTTSNSGLLAKSPNALIYEMEELERSHSKELLLMHAMQKLESMYPELEDLIEQFLNFCGGLPLSLEVIGRSLAGVSNRFYWKNTLAKVFDILPVEIKRRFRSNFENLNEVEKDMVRDIACFFDGSNLHKAISFWDASGISGEVVLKELIKKNVVKLNMDELLIHSQFKLYVMQTLDEENVKDPCKATRLWRPIDVQRALQQSPGFTNVEYLSMVAKGFELSTVPDLDAIPTSNITWREDETGQLHPWPVQCFKKMTKLRLLVIEGACIEGDLCELPKGIIWLRWRFCPHDILPVALPMRNLGVLELDGGLFSALWDAKGPSELPLQLKHLNLQGCFNLAKIPESIGRLVYLQAIVLKDCKALVSLPDEICNAQSLYYMDMSGCCNLEKLPENIGNLKNLQILLLLGCKKLQALPASFGYLDSLIALDISDCKQLRTLSHSIEASSPIRFLNLSGCNLLDLQQETLPRFLETLNLLSCKSFGLLPTIVELTNLDLLKISSRDFTNLPENFGHLSSLTVLHLQGPLLEELPWSVGDLSLLDDLEIIDCPNLKSLVDSIGKLKKLRKLVISSSGLTELPLQIGDICSLESLHIMYCKSLLQLPPSISKLSRLLEFKLVGNPSLRLCHICFPDHSVLTRLVIDECEISDECFELMCKSLNSLESLELHKLPISCIKAREVDLPNLISISIISCNNLVEFEVLPKLRVLEIMRCSHLKLVSVPSAVPMWLKGLTLRHCEELSMIQSIDALRYLEKLDTVGCVNLHYIQGLELVRNLKEMHVFITYWGFLYHGDDWLLKLQKNIYAPAMHFATKTVINKNVIFKHFHKMVQVSNQRLEFELPVSTVPCAWVMVAFLSQDDFESYAESFRRLGSDLEWQNQGRIFLSLNDRAAITTTVHEYPAAKAGETIHFSIFTGDFWLCEQLRSGKKIIVSNTSGFITLGSGWVRMLTIEEESNIEAIQIEFFEELRREKENDLRAAGETEDYFYSKLLELRQRGRAGPSNAPKQEPSQLSEVSDMDDTTCSTVEGEGAQATDVLPLDITTRSAEDMRAFRALDIANCRIVRTHFLVTAPIQAEFLAPTYVKQYILFLQDCVESLAYLHLEMSRACRNATAQAVLYSHITIVQVTVREDYDSYLPMINREFPHFLKSEEEKAIEENPDVVLKVVMDHAIDIANMNQIDEEIRLRREMRRRVQFFADDEGGINMFLPYISTSEDDDDYY